MNKYEEALDRIKKNYYNHDNCLSAMKIFCEDIKTIKELVDKETLIKPEKTTQYDYEFHTSNDCYICGECGHYVYSKDNYCSCCGKRIDWSSE